MKNLILNKENSETENIIVHHSKLLCKDLMLVAGIYLKNIDDSVFSCTDGASIIGNVITNAFANASGLFTLKIIDSLNMTQQEKESTINTVLISFMDIMKNNMKNREKND